MNIIEKIIVSIDSFQQKNIAIAFPFAVIKKVGDDKAGHQAALITYYGFLSLFPLLLVATSVIGIISLNNQELQASIMDGVYRYFPIVGDQLTQNINASTKSGSALIVGLLLAIYGARGGADAFRNALYHMWSVPKKKRTGFPNNILKSVGMTLLGGVGLALAAFLSAYAAGLGRSFVFKILSILVSFTLLVPTFYFLYWISLPRDFISKTTIIRTCIASSGGIVIVQAIGGYLIANQLKTLSPLYGTFAIVLGLLFWIYLQALIVMYATAFSMVVQDSSWPRSLSGKLLTKADKLAIEK